MKQSHDTRALSPSRSIGRDHLLRTFRQERDFVICSNLTSRPGLGLFENAAAHGAGAGAGASLVANRTHAFRGILIHEAKAARQGLKDDDRAGTGCALVRGSALELAPIHLTGHPLRGLQKEAALDRSGREVVP